MFKYLEGHDKQISKEGENLIKLAFEQKRNFSSDIVNFKEEINFPAMS